MAITVTPINDDPVAGDDVANGFEDLPQDVFVLDNDTDADSDLITVTGATDGDHGTVEIVGAGNNVRVQYMPEADFHGADTFTYTVGDGNGGSDTATVTITVNPVNDAPVALDDPSDACGNDGFGGAFPIPEDWQDPFIFFGPCSLVSNDTDVDLDPLTPVIQTQPAHGEALDLGSGFWSYQGTEDDYSTLPGDVPGGSWVSDSFTYVANDGTTEFEPGDDADLDRPDQRSADLHTRRERGRRRGQRRS